MKIKISGKEIEVDNETLKKAIEENSESISIEVEGLTIRDESEESTFVSNITKEAKSAGVEMAVKEARTKLGLEFTGKTIDNLLDAHKSKVIEDAKIEPNKKIQTLETDISTLKKSLQTETEMREQAESQFKSFKNETVLAGALKSVMPQNTVIPADDLLVIMRNKLKLSVSDTGAVVALNDAGEVMKDGKTLEPIPVKDVVKSFFDQNPSYLKDAPGGRGGDDLPGGGGGKMTVEQFVESEAKAGNPTSGDAFMEKVRTGIKEGTISA